MQIELIATASEDSAYLPRLGLGVLAALTPKSDEVIYTDDLERTCSAIEAATAAPLKRVREAGTLRQGFHRLGELIVEVVTFPKIDVDGARFWGLALNAADLDAMFDRYGEDVLSSPKDAVQPGRRISSFRESAGLGLPVALMM